MPQPDTIAAMPEPGTRSPPTQETIAILGVAAALAAIIVGATIHIDNRIDNIATRADADRRAFQTEAAADRRAFQERMDRHQQTFQESMDQHRRDMQRLGERQARLEGQREGGPAQ